MSGIAKLFYDEDYLDIDWSALKQPQDNYVKNNWD